MVNLISISLIKSLGLSPCTRSQHQHTTPILEGVGKTRPQTYGFYHLRLHITDHWNQSLEFICPFLAVNCNARDSQVLLGRPTLKDFKINICNGIDSWEFECKPKVTVASPHKFAQEISSTLRVFAVCIVFRPCEDDDMDPWEDEDTHIIDLSNVSKQLHQKFYDFFNTCNAD